MCVCVCVCVCVSVCVCERERGEEDEGRCRMQIQAFVLGLSSTDWLTNDHLVCVCVCVCVFMCVCVCLLLSRPGRPIVAAATGVGGWGRTIWPLCALVTTAVYVHMLVCVFMHSAGAVTIWWSCVRRAARCLPPCCVICRLISRQEDRIRHADFSGAGIRRNNLAGNDVLRCPDVDPLFHHLCFNHLFFFAIVAHLSESPASVQVDESTGDAVNPGDRLRCCWWSHWGANWRNSRVQLNLN